MSARWRLSGAGLRSSSTRSSRVSARWLLGGALLGGCDDNAPAPPAPQAACAEPVLTVGANTLTRCADGARYGWQHAGRVILDEATAGLRIAGVDALGPSWPAVAWRISDDAAVLTHQGRADLPDFELELTLGPAGLTSRMRFEATEPIVVEALIGTSGGLVTPGTPAFGAAPHAGFGLWLGGEPVGARTDRPGVVHPDGRITRGPLGELAPGAAFEITGDWWIGAPGQALRDAVEATPAPGWGWRTGAAHGAVVDLDALAAERDALLAIAPAPWIVVDGLWAPALGDWRPPAALIAALAPARVGLAWPAALVCPDAPIFADVAALLGPGEGACGRLDLDLPASQDLIARAGIALVDAGVAGLWMDDPRLAAAVGLAEMQAFEGPATLVHLDRVDGAPGAACRAAATAGPFPRDPACDAALSRLDAAVSAPDSDPIAAMLGRLEHLDLPRIAPAPLTLSGAPARARQRLAIAALGGGALLIADAPSTLSAEAVAALQAIGPHDLHRLAPDLTTEAWPPPVWRGAAALALFNWDPAPRQFAIPDAWIGRPGLFDPEAATAEVTVPAGDVRIFLAE